MLQIDERVDGVADDEREQKPRQVFERKSIEIVRVRLNVRGLVDELQAREYAQEFVLMINLRETFCCCLIISVSLERPQIKSVGSKRES